MHEKVCKTRTNFICQTLILVSITDGLRVGMRCPCSPSPSVYLSARMSVPSPKVWGFSFLKCVLKFKLLPAAQQLYTGSSQRNGFMGAGARAHKNEVMSAI